MRYRIMLTLLLSIAINMASGQKYAYHPKYITILNTDKGKRCMHQCSRPVPENVGAFYKITSPDSLLLIQNLKKLLLKRSQYGDRLKKKDMNTYCYQLLGVMAGTKKFIYINAFCIYDMQFKTFSKKGWKTDPVIICGGGRGAWGVLFDPVKQTFSQLSFNGPM